MEDKEMLTPRHGFNSFRKAATRDTHYFQKSSVLSEGPHAPEEGQREDEGSRQAHVTSRVQEKVDGVVDSLLLKNEDVGPHGHEG